MRRVEWPAAAKIRGWFLNVEAHSRGGSTIAGQSTFGRGPGAHFKGKLQVAPMATADALDFQAFLHSLRGRAGTFVLPIPNGYTGNSLAGFTDDTEFSDGTTFDDLVAAEAGTTTTVAAPDGETVDIGALSASPWAIPGAFMWAGEPDRGQLVQIVSLASSVVTVRPRFRFALPIGSPVHVGRVSAEFRLDQNAPVLPLTGFQSRDVELAIVEVRADEENAQGAGGSMLLLMGV